MSDKLPKIIIIVGPTAVGKTALSIELAKHFNGEIINGDSLQVYKGLDIGTAKVTEEEKEGVPHHLLDICEWNEPFTASDFKEKAEAAIAEITSRGKLPIIVGGTGLYIEGLLYGFHYSGEGSNDPDFRLLKEKELEEKGPQVLWNELNEVDPEAAAKISVNNPRRVIRALEVIHATGKKFSSLEIQKTPHYDAFIIGLNTDRALLYGFHYSGEGSNDPDFRLLKEKELEEKGAQALWNELNAVDPEAAAKISVNNPRRVIRALEVIHATGKKFSSLEIQKTPHYDAFIIGLNTYRALLYERINLRVELMCEAGLEEEARDLYEKSKGLDIQSISGIGYKEWIPYFEGEQSREAIIATIQQNSRRYAKRQLTWFRNRLPQIRWVNLLEHPKDKEELLEELSAFVEEG